MLTNEQRTMIINKLSASAAHDFKQTEFTRERGLHNATVCHQEHSARVTKEAREHLFALIGQKNASTHELAAMADYKIEKRPNPMGSMHRALVSTTGEETHPMEALHCTYFLQAILDGNTHNEAQEAANARYYK